MRKFSGQRRHGSQLGEGLTRASTVPVDNVVRDFGSTGVRFGPLQSDRCRGRCFFGRCIRCRRDTGSYDEERRRLYTLIDCVDSNDSEAVGAA